MPRLSSVSAALCALCALLVLVSSLAPQARAAAPGLGGAPEFLPVDQAFVIGADLGVQPARVFWQLEPGYYLYRHRLAFELGGAPGLTPVEPSIPEGKHKTDEYFGEVEVYYDSLDVAVALPADLPDGAWLAIGYQGCADAGLCYPPEKRWLLLTGTEAGTLLDRRPAEAAASGEPARAAAALAPSSTGSGAGQPVTEESRLAALLGGDDLLLALAIFFVAGIGLAFTPCVLPMVPILSSIIAGEDNVTRGRALTLSVVYVLAMALTYALLGTLVGFFGGALNLHGWLQSPPVLVVFAGLFAVLSLSMFGFYELQLPAFLRDRLERTGGAGGRLPGVAAMGVFSSLLVSPCVSAPLAGALVFISSTGDAVLGGGALFVLALGMGVPLLLVGVGGGALLPRAGAWMNAVKAAFGVLLLGVSVWLLERVIPAQLTLLLWAALAVGSGVALGALDFSPRQGIANVWKASGAMLFVYGVLLIIGAASGGADPLRPLAPLAERSGSGPARAEALRFVAVDGRADVQAAIDAAGARGRPVMLDLYADWCISCKVMERNVFPQPAVQAQMARFELLRADVTANEAEHRALLAAYDLFGPPSLLFFAPDGSELRPYRLQGEIGAEDFVAHLHAVLDAAGVEG
ncbi:MAG TPA: protein-disulfide reductase DsbD [Pseudomonadales bacterium]|nr:protein-disulfide reductase DsbD [Pseudomonadales bacterium]